MYRYEKRVGVYERGSAIGNEERFLGNPRVSCASVLILVINFARNTKIYVFLLVRDWVLHDQHSFCLDVLCIRFCIAVNLDVYLNQYDIIQYQAVLRPKNAAQCVTYRCVMMGQYQKSEDSNALAFTTLTPMTCSRILPVPFVYQMCLHAIWG